MKHTGRDGKNVLAIDGVEVSILAEPRANHRGRVIGCNHPTLFGTVGAVTGKSARNDSWLPGWVHLGGHLANLDGLAADDSDDFVRGNV